MDFLENVLLSLLAIVLIVGGIIQLMDMFAIAPKDFTGTLFFLFSAVFLSFYFYYIKKSKNNLKKQIFILIIGLILYAVIFFLVCELL